ncbi:MAG: hypothetical protein ACREND_07965 [Gemmatimonadaceae bacterium]
MIATRSAVCLSIPVAFPTFEAAWPRALPNRPNRDRCALAFAAFAVESAVVAEDADAVSAGAGDVDDWAAADVLTEMAATTASVAAAALSVKPHWCDMLTPPGEVYCRRLAAARWCLEAGVA